MRILFLSQLLPYPPDAGAKVRSYYVLRWLTKRHKVTLVAFTRPDDEPDAIRHLQEFCERVVTVPMDRSWWGDLFSLCRSILARDSFIISRDTNSQMKKVVKHLLGECAYNAIHADQLWMAQYALLAREENPNLRLVLDEHNACFKIFERLASGERNLGKRWLWQREAQKLKEYEINVCRSFDQVITVTDNDRDLLGGQVGEERWMTIPICVDTQGMQAVEYEEETQDVLHLGTMFWPPNIEAVLWFCREVWPRIEEHVPGVGLSIVGKNPPEVVRVLEHQASNIKVPGYVADVHPYFKRAGVFIVPLLSGGGMRVKIIDAWRWGVPIVSTLVGAEGIDYLDKENILIAESAYEFANAIVQVLRDNQLSKRLRQNGRRWVEEKYEWSKVYTKWDQVYPIS